MQRTAAIVAQVDDDAVDVFSGKLLQYPGEVAGGALVVGIAGVVRVEIHIKSRHADDAEPVIAAACGYLQHLALGRLLFEADRIAHDDDFGAVLFQFLGGVDLQSNLRTFLSPDQIDHIVKAPADDVDHFFITLGYTRDAVTGRQLPLFIGGAAGNDTYHLGDFVLHLEHRADALERQRHIDAEVFNTS